MMFFVYFYIRKAAQELFPLFQVLVLTSRFTQGWAIGAHPPPISNFVRCSGGFPSPMYLIEYKIVVMNVFIMECIEVEKQMC